VAGTSGVSVGATGGATTVFVYGTLMPGRLRWPLIEDHVAAHRPATVAGTLLDTGYGYPALLLDGRGTVHGVAVDLHAESAGEALDLLDGIEGQAYRRVEVTSAVGERLETYVWVASTDGFEPIPSGRWAAAQER
jgi:gamma-glutamylcyclotransferase (GGCT)/AIG2-like uncharacterized protein YtfP